MNPRLPSSSEAHRDAAAACASFRPRRLQIGVRAYEFRARAITTRSQASCTA